MKSYPSSVIKITRITKPSLPLCALVAVLLTLASCETPQPILRTVGYDSLYNPIPIATRGRADVLQLVRFFTETNPRIDIDRLSSIAALYIQESRIEGINSDIAFCQMIHETDYLRFGKDVEPWQNNFCGLGATDGGNPGHSFPSVEIGIRAHIQHLKAYASSRRLRRRCVDPRFKKVRRGSAPHVNDLTHRWATDPQYAKKLKQKLQALEKHLTPM